MNTQYDERDEMKQSNDTLSGLVYLAAGLGIGATLAILLAPQSGRETREWISTKCADGMDTVNAGVRRTRKNIADMIDDGKEQVSDAVDAGVQAYEKARNAVA